MTDQRGLRLTVYRSASGYDCTMNGITSRFATCVLVGILDYTAPGASYDKPVRRALDLGSQVSAPGPDSPAVWLVSGKRGGDDRHIIPADENGEPDGRWWMNGGNFVSGDSRFRDLIGWFGAVRVHDRYEG